MKQALNFILGKLDKNNLKFHYLRIGKAAPLLDDLRAIPTEEEFITWEQFEADTFASYHFGPSYNEFDGTLINLGVNDENIAEMRREFWQEFIWKTEDMPQLVAIVYPDTESFGSLTKSQIIEAFSLVRLTDRPFELFENKKGVAKEIHDWITSLSSVVHRKEKDEEKLEEA